MASASNEELKFRAGSKEAVLKGQHVVTLVVGTILCVALIGSWGYFLYDVNREHDVGLRAAYAQIATEQVTQRNNMERLLLAIEAIARQRP